NQTATPLIYTLSLHDALPIFGPRRWCRGGWRMEDGGWRMEDGGWRMEDGGWRMEDGGLCRRVRVAMFDPQSSTFSYRRRSPSGRSEEHTSELQSQSNLVCRLL